MELQYSTSHMPVDYTRRNRTLLIFGTVAGFAYGLLIRFGAELHLPGWTSVMSLAFLGFLPFAMVFITIFVVERREPQPVWIGLLLPWVPVLGASLATIAAFWEGFICRMMFAPIGLVCASFGGVLAGLVQKAPRSLLAKNPGLAFVVLLPVLTTSWVRKLLTRQELRKIENVFDIDAPSSLVWKNIERVPRIYPNELRPSWSHRIGFPSPVEATLSFGGVGGVRHASFERGVLFIETVDAWEPERRLAFSIHAQTDQIPPTTLDEHVGVGGPFFDVLRGECTLDPYRMAPPVSISPAGIASQPTSTGMLISGPTPSWPVCKGQSCAWLQKRCEAEAGGQSVGNR